MNIYSDIFKREAVKKLLSPGSPGLCEVAKKLGIAHSTLFVWHKKYVNELGMKKSKNSVKLSNEEKLNILLKAATLSEQELGEFLRSSGLYSSDLDRFKKELSEGVPPVGRPPLDPEVSKLRREVLDLNKNLKRKDRALAEMSARVILLKKSHEIWGTGEDDE